MTALGTPPARREGTSGQVWHHPGRVPHAMPVNLAVIYYGVTHELTHKN
jgi:hypothetical protein